MRTRTTVLLLAVALLGASCSRSPNEAAPDTTTTTTTTTTGARLPAALVAFSAFDEIALLGDSPGYAGPATPTDLTKVDMPSGFTLTPAQKAALVKNGFVIVPGGFRQFHQAYDYDAYNYATVFVTTDAAYHALHLAFSKVLRETEQSRLLPRLETLLRTGFAAAKAQRDELTGTGLSDAADRVAQLFQAAGSLLGLDVGPLGPLAQQEVTLARAAAGRTASPLTSFRPCNAISPFEEDDCVDYSLFTPRGHYTRNAELERYFRAMSLLGNSAFWLDDRNSLRLGLLASRVLAGNAELAATWREIYEATAFLVGAADDYTPVEVASAADAVAPGWREAPTALADDRTVAAVADRLRARRSVAIDEQTASARIMGARFVIDSYVYDQLRWPFVGTEEDKRITASPLDLAAAMGSRYARTIQESAGEPHFPNYETQLDKVTRLFATRETRQWAGTVYDAWLYALEPVWAPKSAAYPDLMRRDAWTAKDLQTGAASYTELRHDTMLYAKQSFAAEGGGPLDYTPRHWVEPDPVAFGRMSQVLELTRRGLGARNLLAGGDPQDNLLKATIDIFDRLARIAADELARRPISEADNEWLAGFGSVLEGQWLESADIGQGSIGTGNPYEIVLPSSGDTEAAVVADIMHSTFEIVEAATGRIDQLMILVPDDHDRFQLAFGGVYSYYEFSRDAADGRLTDEEWRGMLDSARMPARPAWMQPLLTK